MTNTSTREGPAMCVSTVLCQASLILTHTKETTPKADTFANQTAEDSEAVLALIRFDPVQPDPVCPAPRSGSLQGHLPVCLICNFFFFSSLFVSFCLFFCLFSQLIDVILFLTEAVVACIFSPIDERVLGDNCSSMSLFPTFWDR